MGSLKPWQLILVIVGVLVLGVSLWKSFGGNELELPNRISLVDVGTGDRFYIKTSGRRIAILPERHPVTGERTLFPISKTESGDWAISTRLRADFEGYEGNKSALIDAEHFLIQLSDAKPEPLQ